MCVLRQHLRDAFSFLSGVLLCRIVQIGCAVAYYVLNAIYISQRIGTRLDKNHVPWPDWGWFFVVGAGFLWLLSSILALSKPPLLPQNCSDAACLALCG